MPKLKYTPMSDYDPVSTQVGPHRFEAGKSVEVSDEVYDRLSKNPWFSGDKKAAEKLVTTGNTAPGPDSGIDSSVMPAYPPGGGMKYAPDAVMTEEGMVAPEDASDVDGANVLADEAEKPRRGRPRNS
jgi:hypothetical protein